LDDGIADTLVGGHSSRHSHGLIGHYGNRTSRSGAVKRSTILISLISIGLSL
jgi:hypothetical protein